MDTSMNRRSFLGLAGATGAALAGGSILASCSPAGSGSKAGSSQSDDATAGATDAKSKAALGNNKAKDSYDIKETKQADLVVVGGGVAGAAAACRGRELGLNVTLVEAANNTGGTSVMTEGLFAVDSHWQKENGKNPADLGYDLFSIAMDYHHQLCDGHLLRSLMNASAANIDWIESLGIKIAGTGTMSGNEYNTWHLYETYDDPNTISGQKYVDDWRSAMDELGVDIMLSTTAVDLEQNGDGSIAAVICDTGNGFTKIETKAVVMATGGYGDNAQMVKEFTGMSEDKYISMGRGGRSGLGIAMARAAGGQLADAPGTCMFYGGNLPGIQYGTELYCASAFQPLFWVNQNAKRFINEWYAERNFNFSGNGQSKQKKVFSIVTKAQMDKMATEGGWFGCGEYLHAGEPLTGLWDEYNQQKAAGNTGIFEGDTLDDIAKQTGLDADALKEEVENYNKMCAAGKDTEFSKDPQYLIPLESGPYYCFELQTGFFTTVGGMKVNDKAQVLDANDEPIVGLYAAGCDAGGLYGDSYDVSICEGSQQAWCVQSGKVAAEDVAENLV